MKSLKVKNMILEVGRPKIAAVITGRTHDEIIEQVQKAVKLPCDMLEWRADYFFGEMSNLDAKVENTAAHMEMIRILDDIDYQSESMPLIFTLRTNGGSAKVDMSREHAYDLSALAAQSKLVDFIDMELLDADETFNPEQVMKQVEEVHSFGVGIIHSHHEFDKVLTLEETINVANSMRTMGADMVKIATIVNSEEEATGLLKAAAYLTQGDNKPVIIIGMGKPGIVTRIAGGNCGSCISFAYIDEATAPGQFDVKTLSDLFDEYYR